MFLCAAKCTFSFSVPNDKVVLANRLNVCGKIQNFVERVVLHSSRLERGVNGDL